ncbi:MAG TPA: hypothetical protein VMW15_14715 [Terracidiphilus sp.]|nr:hypothetical protein [Terracidiphilus sp.]
MGTLAYHKRPHGLATILLNQERVDKSVCFVFPEHRPKRFQASLGTFKQARNALTADAHAFGNAGLGLSLHVQPHCLSLSWGENHN